LCDTLALPEFIFVSSVTISTVTFFVCLCAEPLPPGEYQKKTGKQKTRSCVLLFRRKTAVKLKDEARTQSGPGRGCTAWEAALQSQLKYPNSDHAEDADLGDAIT